MGLAGPPFGASGPSPRRVSVVASLVGVAVNRICAWSVLSWVRVMNLVPRRRRSLPNAVLLAGLLLAWSPCAVALNPTLDVSQYAHMSWRIREGFTKGVIVSMAQTPDGYLWLGTEY